MVQLESQLRCHIGPCWLGRTGFQPCTRWHQFVQGGIRDRRRWQEDSLEAKGGKNGGRIRSRSGQNRQQQHTPYPNPTIAWSSVMPGILELHPQNNWCKSVWPLQAGWGGYRVRGKISCYPKVTSAYFYPVLDTMWAMWPGCTGKGHSAI